MLFQKIINFDEIESTQIKAKELAEDGEAEGTIVIAEQQTSGYGRLQHYWASPKGGIWFSAILRPHILPEKAPQITLLAAVVLCRTLKNLFNLHPYIKWPNDILLNNKKVAGILTEVSIKQNKIDWIVLGMGINVNNEYPDHIKEKTTSINKMLGREISLENIFSTILNEFSDLYPIFYCDGFHSFRNEFKQYFGLFDKTITVSTLNGSYSGCVRDIDKDGFLLLELPNGELSKVIAGDIQ